MVQEKIAIPLREYSEITNIYIIVLQLNGRILLGVHVLTDKQFIEFY